MAPRGGGGGAGVGAADLGGDRGPGVRGRAEARIRGHRAGARGHAHHQRGQCQALYICPPVNEPSFTVPREEYIKIDSLQWCEREALEALGAFSGPAL